MAYPITVAPVNGQWVNLATSEPLTTFIDGVTMPYYVETLDFTGSRNVGIPAGQTLVPYSGNGAGNNVIQLTAGGLVENVLFRGVVEVRAPTTFVNCRFMIDSAFTRTDLSTKSVVQVLNGANARDVHLQNCEIHVRAQRPFNGIQGRNFTMDKCVITGANDAFSESANGSAPNTGFGFEATNCCVPSLGWWYSSPANLDIHSDTGAHVDAMQKETLLTVKLTNCTLAAVASEIVGTGTPGSGRDAGNTYVPGSGADYTANQAQMEAWREQFSFWTTPSQSMHGVSRRLMTAGSMACIMGNDGNLTLDHCWFSGGTVQINAEGATGSIATSIHIKNSVHWNDMLNGPGSRATTPTVKGHAVIFHTGETFGTFTNNKWFDGTDIVIARL